MAIEAAALKVVVSADTSKAEGDLKSFSGTMKGMAGGLASVGGVLAAGISAPLIGIGVAAVNTAATFEKSMNVLGYVTEGTSAQMQAMSDQALQLGADTVFSANEAAAGMVELAKAGMDTEQVMDSIPGVMALAAAGGIAVEEAATLASATLNTFGLEASKSAEVADILAAAANASAADVRDLAFGVQNAGSVFAASGQSVDTLATMMAILANNGLNASDAATSVKTMTMRLTAPTAKAAGVMEDLGIAVFDTHGAMRDYRDIIEDMEVATKGLSDEQRAAAFNTVFGADAIRSALIFAKEGVDVYDEMNRAVNEQGASAQMAAAQNSGLAGAMEQIGGSLESLMTKLALPFLEPIAAGMGTLTEFINQMGELPQPVINAGLAFAAFAASIGLVMVAAAGIMAAVGSPILLVGLAVLGLGAAVAALWVAWETNWMNIQGTTAAVLGVIQPLIDTLASTLAGIGTAIAGFGAAITTSFAEANIPTFDELFADLLAGDFGGLTTKLQDALDSVVARIKVNFEIEAKFKEGQNQLQQAWQKLTTFEPTPPKLTIAPFPAVNMQPPEVKFVPEKPVPQVLAPPDVTIAPLPPEPMPKIPSFSSFAIPAANNMMQGITTSLEGQNWHGAGQNIVNGIVDAVANAFTTSGKIVVGIIPFVANMQMAFNEAILGLGEEWSPKLGASLSAMSSSMGAWLTTTAALLETNFMAMAGAFDTALTGLITGMRDAIVAQFQGLLGSILGALVPERPAAMTNGLNMGSPEVDWGDMPEFVWPALPTFSWPTLPVWEWVAYPTWEWPKLSELYAWDWPSMSMPGWVGTLIGALGGAMDALRGGGSQQGPRQDNVLPRPGGGGGTVPASFPLAAASMGRDPSGGGVTIILENVTVNNGMDVEVLAAQLARRFQQKMRL